MLLALEGSVGYGMGGARVEIEVGYERFPIQGVSGGKGDDGDTVFLLAKELANDVVRNQTEKLSTAIGNVTRKEMHSFAEDIEINAEKAKGKICAKVAGSTGSSGSGVTEEQLLKGGDGYCGCFGVADGNSSGGACKTRTSGGPVAGAAREGQSWSKVVSGELKNAKGSVDSGTAKEVAKNIKDLEDRDEKIKVAGAFARTIEGAEVKNVASLSKKEKEAETEKQAQILVP